MRLETGCVLTLSTNTASCFLVSRGKWTADVSYSTCLSTRTATPVDAPLMNSLLLLSTAQENDVCGVQKQWPYM